MSEGPRQPAAWATGRVAPRFRFLMDPAARAFLAEEELAEARTDLAAAQAQVARLTAVITAALDDLEARDELSALDGLRAALATGAPPAEPGTEE